MNFANVELKPLTKSSINKFFDQLQDWNEDGDVEGDIELFLDDEGGTISSSGFIFD